MSATRLNAARWLLALVFAGLGAAPAWAASLLVLATDRDGKPLADAVITVHVPNAAPKPADKPVVVSQEAFAFKPFVTVVAVGSQLSFPNRDRVAHHLRTASQEYRFEFPVYEPGRTPQPVKMDKVGTIELNCLIHTSMRGFVRVVDTPFVALTDEHGAARIDGIPDGRYEVRGWHPDLIFDGPKTATMFGAAPVNLPMQFPLRPKPRPRADGY
jgi:plastocyanin